MHISVAIAPFLQCVQCAEIMHVGIALNPPLGLNYLAIYFCFETVPLMIITYNSSELTTL